MPATRLPLTGATLTAPLEFDHPGMPSLDTVHDVTTFAPQPGGATYQILRTVEFDSYEESSARTAIEQQLQRGVVSATAIAEALAAAVGPPSDSFGGTARRAAKLSIGTGQSETLADVEALIATLPADHLMVTHSPPISTAPTSRRAPEEQRNVRVVGFLYAASRETDNDFHLVVGRSPTVTPEMYMTVEISGLPPTNSAAYQKLNAVRNAFKKFFGAHLPLLSYDFYHPPIPVVIEGSLFFDMTHATGQAPGPPSLKSRMPTIWEIHPVTAITLGSTAA